MFEFIKKYYKKKVNQIIPIKDPDDNKLTSSSTEWLTQHYWCGSCKTNRSHRQFMSGCCNSCGTFNNVDLFGAAIRKIWNGEKWVRQIRERSGKTWVED